MDADRAAAMQTKPKTPEAKRMAAKMLNRTATG
jgi:hypothetical protein